MVICVFLVSCPTNNLLDPPADCRAGQGAPTRHSGYYGEEAQRRPARQDAAQRVSYWWDRTLGWHRRSPSQRWFDHQHIAGQRLEHRIGGAADVRERTSLACQDAHYHDIGV